jgi:hypothetical protein
MDFLSQTRFIERLQFFNGQRLFASDLQGLEAFNREMRWLHNQSLHQPGIGNGFAVSGKKGDREVTIGPGYAIDAEGREIVLMQNQIEPIPPVAGEADGGPALYDLTVSYPDDAFLEETERREGICNQPGGTIRLKEEPVFCWIALDENGQPKDAKQKREIAAGMRVVLARVEIVNCQLHKNLSTAQRLSARPSTQPYICCREATPKWLEWTLAPFEPDLLRTSASAKTLVALLSSNPTSSPMIWPFGLQAEIDTSRCGFRTTPCYSARIAGPRIKQIPQASDPEESDGDQVFTFVIDGLMQIVAPQPDKFTVQVLLIAQQLFGNIETPDVPSLRSRRRRGKAGAANNNALANLAQRLKNVGVATAFQDMIDQLFSDWTVVWMGIEG